MKSHFFVFDLFRTASQISLGSNTTQLPEKIRLVLETVVTESHFQSSVRTWVHLFEGHCFSWFSASSLFRNRNRLFSSLFETSLRELILWTYPSLSTFRTCYDITSCASSTQWQLDIASMFEPGNKRQRIDFQRPFFGSWIVYCTLQKWGSIYRFSTLLSDSPGLWFPRGI